MNYNQQENVNDLRQNKISPNWISLWLNMQRQPKISQADPEGITLLRITFLEFYFEMTEENWEQIC